MCVVQRKGRCGSVSAPRRCLRRQAKAAAAAANAAMGASARGKPAGQHVFQVPCISTSQNRVHE